MDENINKTSDKIPDKTPDKTSEKDSTQEEVKEYITLEMLTTQLNDMKNEFNENLKSKDNEIIALKENNAKLTKMLDEQNALIGNFREKIFNTATIPQEEVVAPEQIYLDQCYKDAFAKGFSYIQHRTVGDNNNKDKFVNRCLEMNKW